MSVIIKFPEIYGIVKSWGEIYPKFKDYINYKGLLRSRWWGSPLFRNLWNSEELRGNLSKISGLLKVCSGADEKAHFPEICGIVESWGDIYPKFPDYIKVCSGADEEAHFPSRATLVHTVRTWTKQKLLGCSMYHQWVCWEQIFLNTLAHFPMFKFKWKVQNARAN